MRLLLEGKPDIGEKEPTTKSAEKQIDDLLRSFVGDDSIFNEVMKEARKAKP